MKILQKLDFGFKVSYNIVGAERNEFNDIVKELADEGFVTYITESNELFKDDVKNVKITDLGKEFLQRLND